MKFFVILMNNHLTYLRRTEMAPADYLISLNLQDIVLFTSRNAKCKNRLTLAFNLRLKVNINK